MCMGERGRFGIRVLFLLALAGISLTSGCVAERTENVTPDGEAHLTVTSDSFREGGTIPASCGCSGQENCPALEWSGVPERAASLAIVMEDLDFPWLRLTHWIIYNIPPSSSGIASHPSPLPALPDGSIQGLNDFRMIGYRGPCPPRGNAHRYQFTVFALDRVLDSTVPVDRARFNTAIQGAIIGKGTITGFYSRT
jgi:Raf kinase inhibitor-like YbhB/YbcL family protein